MPEVKANTQRLLRYTFDGVVEPVDEPDVETKKSQENADRNVAIASKSSDKYDVIKLDHDNKRQFKNTQQSTPSLVLAINIQTTDV